MQWIETKENTEIVLTFTPNTLFSFFPKNPHPSTCRYRINLLHQHIFQVLVIGGRSHIITQLALHTAYIPGIYCLRLGVIQSLPPITRTRIIHWFAHPVRIFHAFVGSYAVIWIESFGFGWLMIGLVGVTQNLQSLKPKPKPVEHEPPENQWLVRSVRWNFLLAWPILK